MQNIFDFRNEVIDEYSKYSRSFIEINAKDIKETVDTEYEAGKYWLATHSKIRLLPHPRSCTLRLR